MNSVSEYCYKYPHYAIAADTLTFKFESNKLQVLLIKRKNDPYKDCWALPGGFMNVDETTEDTAKRELFEETNINVDKIYQLGAYDTVDRDPRERVISIVYYCFVQNNIKPKAADDAKELRWYNIEKLPTLGFDHNIIIDDCLKKLREDFTLNPLLGKQLLPKTFTINDLHALYESIYIKKMNKSILQNKLIKQNIITGKKMKLADSLTQPPKQFSYN